MSAIEIDSVGKRFKERGKLFSALDKVSLEVKEGEVFGLLGPNGAGKTTLLNIMVKLLLPDEGTVRILGQDIFQNEKVLEKVNFVSGDSKFHWTLRVRDILHFYGRSYHLPDEVRRKRVEELLDFFDIRKVSHRRFSHLSTGERMRLMFAKAMLNRPKVLLLDEPTLGLDPSIAIKVRQEIKRVNKKYGTTILLTSHYMHEVEQLADRVAFIYGGKIVDIGTVERVKRKRFAWYQVEIKVKKIVNKRSLEKKGFTVSGRVLKKQLKTGENISSLLSFLHKKGYSVLEVNTKKPSLEDYFVRILGEEVTHEEA